jgi:hypothetical protein
MTMATVDARVHQRILRASPDQPLDDDALADLVRSEAPLLDAADVTAVVGQVRARIGGLGPIEPLLADPAVRAPSGSSAEAPSNAPTFACRGPRSTC